MQKADNPEAKHPAAAPREVLELVAHFGQQLDSYKSGHYNEAQLRQEFLNPLFKALGWDIHNKQGYAEAYKDVIHEDAIRIGGAVKAPDYCFRIGGTRKFFLEAKKPSVCIKDEPTAAYQLRRYAWSAKLPLSVLSDFEEFAVYDCRIRPHKDDPAAVARIFYCTFRELGEKWDWITSIFSREAVLKGSFDKFAESSKGKRGTSEVDAAFLAEIENWRSELARNLALRNPKLTQRELNFAVQRIIDRIIFLRICEDRGIEDYGRLRALVNGDGIYPRLCQLFEAADARYNSGLFHFKREKDRHEDPDELTLALDLDDKLLRDILRGLYYPDSPYEFSVLSADILGQVYEQFLGKVIRLTEGHRAVVDDKPEVKKAGGVYYTPTYIVDYIVRQTVGELVEGKTPRQVEKLRVLDPACGSGSFLTGTYQFLLDWHRDWYTQNQPEKYAKGGKPALVQTGKGWKLTIDARKAILLNNIFGVDIDTQAVEVTKLSLLLKVLEGETGQSLQTIFRLFQERALPDLGDNIKCGNSLIGPDFYQQQQMDLLDDEARYRVNVFDWKDGFPEIFKAGGFDAVIGNPPYVLGRETFDVGVKAYLASHYESFGGKYDLYVYFTEKAVWLTRDRGRLAYILPNTLLANENAARLRRLLTERTHIEFIRTFSNRVFKQAQVESVIIVLAKEQPSPASTITIEANKVSTIAQSTFSKSTDCRFSIYSDSQTEDLLGKVRSGTVSLGSLCSICIGIQLGGSSGNHKKESFLNTVKLDGTFKPVLDGKNINRYRKAWPGIYVRYGDWLHRKRDEKYFLNEKILIRQIGAAPIATFDDTGLYTLNTIYNLVNVSGYSLRYLLGIVNSKLGRWFWSQVNSDFKSLFPKIKKAQLESIPIHSIELADSAAKATHDRLVKLVEQMLALQNQLAAARTPQEQTALTRQIAATDTQIDRLVYDLYGLTEEEISIVEESSN